MSRLWPEPGDTPAERARRIANSLLKLLPSGEQEIWRARAHALGETWLGSDLARWDVDDVVSTKDAAALVYVGVSTISKWCSEGDLRNVARGRYRVGDVIDCAARQRRRRATRRSVAA